MPARHKIAILGRKKDISNYENFLSQNGYEPIPTLKPGDVVSCDGLLLPGGGDITPAFFGAHDHGSRNIDTELDILQFWALELCLRRRLPVLGICKGMQLINVAFGGSVRQDMQDSSLHLAAGRDLYHLTSIETASPLGFLLGEEAVVNSAHHQCIERVGNNLRVVQRSIPDNCPEALVHETLPVCGLQWHPERLDPARSSLSGATVLAVFEAQLWPTPS